jgi:hypothetical protein
MLARKHDRCFDLAVEVGFDAAIAFRPSGQMKTARPSARAKRNDRFDLAGVVDQREALQIPLRKPQPAACGIERGGYRVPLPVEHRLACRDVRNGRARCAQLCGKRAARRQTDPDAALRGWVALREQRLLAAFDKRWPYGCEKGEGARAEIRRVGDEHV